MTDEIEATGEELQASSENELEDGVYWMPDGAPGAVCSPLTLQQQQKALKAVLRLLDRWGCSDKERQILLGVDEATVRFWLEGRIEQDVKIDVMERLSLLLNIHAALRTLFGTEASVYEWVRRPNQGPFFRGRSAMDILLQGRVSDLYDVLQRLNCQVG